MNIKLNSFIMRGSHPLPRKPAKHAWVAAALSLTYLVLSLFPGAVNAELVKVGTATYNGSEYNFLYENTKSLVWFDYTHRGDWNAQMSWVQTLGQQLTINLSLGYSTTIDWTNGWRLPSAGENPQSGIDIISSEMGYLYYVSLGNQARGLTTIGPFEHLEPYSYQYATEYAPDPANRIWVQYFNTNGVGGFQYWDYKGINSRGLAVHTGEITATVVPSELVTIEPDSFTSGTSLTNAFPGVTISQGNGETNIIAATGITGSQEFGIAGAPGEAGYFFGLPIPATSDLAATLAGARYGGKYVLRVDFASPTDFVSIDLIPDDSIDPGSIAAFDSAGTLLGTDFYITSTPGVRNTLSVSVPGIATLLAAGRESGGETVGIDTLRYHDLGVTSDVDGTFGPPGSNSGVPFSKDPINLVTGNYIYQWYDLEMAGRGMPLVISRTYNSLDTYDGPLGLGWTHSYNMNLTETSSGDVVVMRGDGRRDLYSRDSDGFFSPPLGNYTELVAHSDGRFTLEDKDRTSYVFNPDGRLTQIKDPNGNIQVLNYDTVGNLVSITDTVGRMVIISYNSDSRITSITDPIGRTISYSYDESGNLVEVVDPAAAITAYRYDNKHRLLTVTDPLGYVAVTNIYDAEGRVSEQTDASGQTTTFTYDPENNLIVEKDPLDREALYTYNEDFLLIKQNDAAGGVTTFVYDANKNRTSITDSNGNTTSFAYDSRGNLTRVIDALGGTSRFAYDENNNLLSYTDEIGRTTSFGHDEMGNTISMTDAMGGTATLTYNTIGQVVKATNAKGEATAFEYDSDGNLTRITDPLGHKTDYIYDAVGRLTVQTDDNGNKRSLQYDALDHIVSFTDPLGNTVNFIYNANGNIIQLTDANGEDTKFDHDTRYQLVRVTDALDGVISYTYNSVGNLINLVDANGHQTSYTYDDLNRLVKETDPLGNVVNRSYDAVGHLIKLVDAKGQLTAYTYDALYRLTNIAYSDGSTVTYSYDAVGNRTKMVDSIGTTSYVYNVLNNPVSVTFPGDKTVTYTYDALGNRLGLTYPDGKTVGYKYDAADRLESLKDWEGKVTTYSYDSVGNLVQITHPNDTVIKYNYDAVDRLVEVTNLSRGKSFARFTYNLDPIGNRTSTTFYSMKKNDNGQRTYYSYDALSRLTGVTAAESEQSFTYDAMGNRLSMSVNGREIIYEYDPGDRIVTADDISYDYDANGNRISRVEKNKVFAYTYDSADRLVEVSGPMVPAHFAYNGDGNRVQVRIGDEDDFSSYSYTWDVASYLSVAITEAGPEGTKNQLYNGLNLLSASGPDYRNYYHYDGLGSVVGLTNDDGAVKRTYAYDAWGNPTNAPGLFEGENKFGFTGEHWDERTGLLYLRARYYDPSVGRFISRDLFPGFSYYPPSLNRWAYAANNPINLVDRSGLLASKPTITIGSYSPPPEPFYFMHGRKYHLYGPLPPEDPSVTAYGYLGFTVKTMRQMVRLMQIEYERVMYYRENRSLGAVNVNTKVMPGNLVSGRIGIGSSKKKDTSLEKFYKAFYSVRQRPFRF